MIGGNVEAIVQVKLSAKDAIGGNVNTYVDGYTLKGFLDYMGGDSNMNTFNAKIQQSTHVFICDYRKLDIDENECQMVIDDKVYEIMLIDNPMFLNKHLEFYLKYVGE